jgi:hypothetical protein
MFGFLLEVRPKETLGEAANVRSSSEGAYAIMWTLKQC